MEKRYLSSWNYNAALILAELETIVKNNGGEICSTWEYSSDAPKWVTERKQYLIINRGLNDAIRELKALHERIEKVGKKPSNESLLKLEQMESVKNDPIVSYHGDYLYTQFVLNGDYYYYQLDKNPFFEFYYNKVKVDENNKINKNCYLDNDKKEWLIDCYSYNVRAEDRKKAANLIFNMLVSANYSSVYRGKEKPKYSNIIKVSEV